jgi:YfiR/HmsC-like
VKGVGVRGSRPDGVWRAALRLAVVCAAHAALLGAAGDAGAQPTSDEHSLKAAFLAKFPEFVRWPDPVWANQRAVVICLTDSTPFTRQLQSLTAGAQLGDRFYEVRTVRPDAAVDACHLLFMHDLVASGELLARAAKLPILTVSDDPAFLDRGGIILLRTVGRRVRFDVNVSAAHRVELRVSSQLLNLAMHVRREPSS